MDHLYYVCCASQNSLLKLNSLNEWPIFRCVFWLALGVQEHKEVNISTTLKLSVNVTHLRAACLLGGRKWLGENCQMMGYVCLNCLIKKLFLFMILIFDEYINSSICLLASCSLCYAVWAIGFGGHIACMTSKHKCHLNRYKIRPGKRKLNLWKSFN